MFSMVPNQVIGEVVLDGGGHFIAAGMFGVHALSLVLSSQAAHGRATVDVHPHNITQDKSRLTHTETLNVGTVHNTIQTGR